MFVYMPHHEADVVLLLVISPTTTSKAIRTVTTIEWPLRLKVPLKVPPSTCWKTASSGQYTGRGVGLEGMGRGNRTLLLCT